MARTFLISVACADRTGLIAAIAGCLFDIGGNLGDTTFAVLGTEAEFTSLVDLPEHLSVETVRRELAALAETGGARIEVAPYDRPTVHGPLGRATHVITVAGGDQPGLIARIAEVFVEFGANIIHMEAGREPGPEPPGRYLTRFSVAIPAANAEKCLATVANTAGAMDLSCAWTEVNI
ncbi:MAG TPA: ACT domain-containing protein [Alphaproteobacteria bacterium]|jgi:glycine cleavage system transcriptional repressor